MIICDRCFASERIQQVLERVGHNGNCPTCGSRDGYIFNTDHISEEAPELIDWFGDLLSHFTYEDETISNAPDREYDLLKSELRNNWNIFSEKITEKNVYDIIKSICGDIYTYDKSLFNRPVVFREKYNQEVLNKKSLTRGNNWEDFVKEITKENRFHTRTINLEVLEKLLEFMRVTIHAGEVFYRCRINHSDEHFKPEEMKAPPPQLASSGRANARGIPCLYLADDPRTAISEVRAGAYDTVTVGRFRLLHDIPVIDFRLLKSLCPIGIDMDYIDYAINHDHLVKIDREMAKGLKSGDHSVDYVATQYITDFIKSIRRVNEDGKIEKQYWGILYNSTLHEQGYNLAVFYEDAFKYMSSKEYQVKTVQYFTNPQL